MHDRDAAVIAGGRGRDPGGERLFVGHGRREPNAPAAGCQLLQPGQPQGQQIAPLGVGHGVQLVDHDAFQPPEDGRRVGVGEQQRQGFRRGQQDLRRLLALALAFRLRGVAGAGLGGDGKSEFCDRGFEIAMDIDRKRLQRRDIERMEMLGGRRIGERDQAGQEPGQGLAATGGRHEQGRAAGAIGRQQRQLMRMRPPAAAGEPGGKCRRQDGDGIGQLCTPTVRQVGMALCSATAQLAPNRAHCIALRYGGNRLDSLCQRCHSLHQI